eukprot:8943811-Alexandrium_andersonii.AAC.1
MAVEHSDPGQFGIASGARSLNWAGPRAASKVGPQRSGGGGVRACSRAGADADCARRCARVGRNRGGA